MRHNLSIDVVEKAQFPMLKFASSEFVGSDHHRSGWSWAMESLLPLCHPSGILFEDFVDCHFGWHPIAMPYQEPWVGVFHKPPNWPSWLGDTSTPNTIDRILSSDLFVSSSGSLRGGIVFSEHLASWLRERLEVSVEAIKHPTEHCSRKFSVDEFDANRKKRILQIGYVLRNTRAIFQLSNSRGFTKSIIRVKNASAARMESQVSKYWQDSGIRSEFGEVEELDRLDNDAYDGVLTRNIVMLEFFDCSVSNTVLECIERATPLVVNRLPALQEYLGNDYPLFYDSIEDIPSLLDRDLIIDAHRHLDMIDKSAFSRDVFRESVSRIAARCQN